MIEADIMEEETDHIDELIIAYLTKEINTVDFNELKAWIAASPENERFFLQQQELWFSVISEKEDVTFDKVNAFEQFRSRIKERQNSIVKRQRYFQISTLWRYAAVVATVFTISGFSYWWGARHIKGKFSKIVVEAPIGSRSKLCLPDGSLVWLNAGTSIVYSQGFGVDNREIELTGEGYFEVKQNEQTPFFVKTKSLQVKVLGTKFNFRDYPEDKEAIVSLSEGKVSVINLVKVGGGIFLNPNERAVLNKKNERILVEQAIAANAAEWKDGYLFFDEELLPDIVKELERSYNVKIQITNDSLKSFRFYGNFVRREQSITEVLNALASTGRIKYTMKDNIIALY